MLAGLDAAVSGTQGSNMASQLKRADNVSSFRAQEFGQRAFCHALHSAGLRILDTSTRDRERLSMVSGPETWFPNKMNMYLF